MADKITNRSDVITSLAEAEAVVAAPPNLPDASAIARVIELLRDVERATPGGAGLHAQLDTVTKWVTLLANSSEHKRFGGGSQDSRPRHVAVPAGSRGGRGLPALETLSQ